MRHAMSNIAILLRWFYRGLLNYRRHPSLAFRSDIDFIISRLRMAVVNRGAKGGGYPRWLRRLIARSSWHRNWVRRRIYGTLICDRSWR